MQSFVYYGGANINHSLKTILHCYGSSYNRKVLPAFMWEAEDKVISIISLEEFFKAEADTSGSTVIATNSVATLQICLSLQHSESLQHRASTQSNHVTQYQDLSLIPGKLWVLLQYVFLREKTIFICIQAQK